MIKIKKISLALLTFQAIGLCAAVDVLEKLHWAPAFNSYWFMNDYAYKVFADAREESTKAHIDEVLAQKPYNSEDVDAIEDLLLKYEDICKKRVLSSTLEKSMKFGAKYILGPINTVSDVAAVGAPGMLVALFAGGAATRSMFGPATDGADLVASDVKVARWLANAALVGGGALVASSLAIHKIKELTLKSEKAKADLLVIGRLLAYLEEQEFLFQQRNEQAQPVK